jgi:hypothetical protein
MHRTSVSASVAAMRRRLSTVTSAHSRTLEGSFGVYAFSRAVQEKYVAGSALSNIEAAAIAGTPVEMVDADHYARGLMSWALDNNASYVHARSRCSCCRCRCCCCCV